MQYNRTSEDDIVRVDFTCRRWQAEKLERVAVKYKNGNKSEVLRSMINNIDERENNDCFKVIRQAATKLIIENTPYTQESVENYINAVVAGVKEKLSTYPEFGDLFTPDKKDMVEETTEILAGMFLSKQNKLKEDKQYNGGLFFHNKRTPYWLR